MDDSNRNQSKARIEIEIRAKLFKLKSRMDEVEDKNHTTGEAHTVKNKENDGSRGRRWWRLEEMRLRWMEEMGWWSAPATGGGGDSMSDAFLCSFLSIFFSSFFFLFLILRPQKIRPLEPRHLPNLVGPKYRHFLCRKYRQMILMKTIIELLMKIVKMLMTTIKVLMITVKCFLSQMFFMMASEQIKDMSRLIIRMLQVPGIYQSKRILKIWSQRCENVNVYLVVCLALSVNQFIVKNKSNSWGNKAIHTQTEYFQIYSLYIKPFKTKCTQTPNRLKACLIN